MYMESDFSSFANCSIFIIFSRHLAFDIAPDKSLDINRERL